MQLKECLNSPCGLDYMIENLDLQSSCARQLLMDSMYCNHPFILEAEYAVLKQFYAALGRKENQALWDALKGKLMDLKNIRHTLHRLWEQEVLDDLELFEVKHLALLVADVRLLLHHLGLDDVLHLPDVEKVVEVLDPEGLRMATFYIYNVYSEELAALREQWRAAAAYKEELFLQVSAKEAEIRERLCRQLRSSAEYLEQAQNVLARIDVLQAKVRQMQELNLCFPEVKSEGESCYRNLFHPKVKAALEVRNKAYQPVNIAFGGKPTLIVGANMGGKTVVLKSVALCQYLCQFAFGIPAESAQIVLKDDVVFCIGDHQDASDGLSSFAAEMQQTDMLIQEARRGKRLLALLDEPARTTNPAEGTALVRGLLEVLRTLPVSLLMATHYSLPFDGTQRCLKVRGMQDSGMDYTLEEVENGEVPREALRMAEHLGVDAGWLSASMRLLEDTK